VNSTNGTDGITEDDIAGYLANTAGLSSSATPSCSPACSWPARTACRAVSLQERQMENAAQRIKNLERKIMEMIRYGQDNMAISDRLHRWTRTVMLTHDLRTARARARARPAAPVPDPQAAVRIWGVAPELAHLPCAAEVSDDVKIFATSLVAPYAGPTRASRRPAGFDNAESVMSLA